ncbi:MAG TPA: ferritin-like domain-containing protein [Solirubrobacteraceae bacterium]|jgi:rubrerythrin
MSDLHLDDLDRDGALVEAIGRLHGTTRADLLRGAIVGGGALLAAAASPASAASNSVRDVSILNFALTLEELQAVFYTEVERNRVLRGKLKRQADTVGGHERAHVKAFRAVLGSAAIKRPHFDFGGATEGPEAFRRTAVAFEDLAVAAYKGQAPRITSRQYLASAIAIHSVEARHAAWIRRLAAKPPVSGPFDEPLTRPAVTRIVDRTHFVMAMTSTKGPKFTG